MPISTKWRIKESDIVWKDAVSKKIFSDRAIREFKLHFDVPTDAELVAMQNRGELPTDAELAAEE